MSGQAAWAQDSASGASGPYPIHGRVLNANTGLPVWRALVRLNNHAMLTGHDGSFEFDGATDASGTVLVSKPGFYPSTEWGFSPGLSVPREELSKPLELRLYPEAIFTGTVTASDGEPLPHVIVVARRSTFDDRGHHWIPVSQVQTNAHGQFRLPVPAGDYRLATMYAPRLGGGNEAVLPVSVPADGVLTIKSGEQQNFDLHPAMGRTYKVKATFDSDVEGGFPRIVARSSSGLAIPMPVNISRTDTRESVRMELPTGTYQLMVTMLSRAGVEQGSTAVTVTNHDIDDLALHLSPVPKLPVELLVDDAATSDNAPPKLQQFGLTLENTNPDADFFNSSIYLATQRDQTAEFTVPPGTYRLRARGSGGWYVKSAMYGATDLLQQDLVIAAGAGAAQIRVTVSDQVAALQGVCRANEGPVACWVYLVPSTPSAEPVYTVRSNLQGAFNLEHLPPGNYRAIAFEQRHQADYSDAATLTPFAAHVKTVTLRVGEKPMLELDAVATGEMNR
ncbi:MAG TPA: carboxypeptidase-like regulatory domain-containing protein [Edaphobacter sp.]|nr:carboxypeptidase-like regulatory domain-containing protein [Edaphobacter sp.]